MYGTLGIPRPAGLSAPIWGDCPGLAGCLPASTLLRRNITRKGKPGGSAQVLYHKVSVFAAGATLPRSQILEARQVERRVLHRLRRQIGSRPATPAHHQPRPDRAPPP